MSLVSTMVPDFGSRTTASLASGRVAGGAMDVDAAVAEQIEIAVELDRRLPAGRRRTRVSTQLFEVAARFTARHSPSAARTR